MPVSERVTVGPEQCEQALPCPAISIIDRKAGVDQFLILYCFLAGLSPSPDTPLVNTRVPPLAVSRRRGLQWAR